MHVHCSVSNAEVACCHLIIVNESDFVSWCLEHLKKTTHSGRKPALFIYCIQPCVLKHIHMQCIHTLYIHTRIPEHV